MYEALLEYTKKFTRSELRATAYFFLGKPDDEGRIHCWAQGIEAAQAGKHEAPYKVKQDPMKTLAWSAGHKQLLFASGELTPEDPREYDHAE